MPEVAVAKLDRLDGAVADPQVSREEDQEVPQAKTTSPTKEKVTENGIGNHEHEPKEKLRENGDASPTSATASTTESKELVPQTDLTKPRFVKGIGKNGKTQLDHIDFAREARNRVKLYVLCEQRIWDDRGTGHVACIGIPDHSGYAILVRLETNGSDEKSVLESKIHMDTVYQKQQETLIVWSESDSCDLALSFQEKSGCEEIWAKICEVQGKDPGPTNQDASYDDIDEGELSEGSSSANRIILPPIEMGRLPELDTIIAGHITTQQAREKMVNTIETEDVVNKLIDVFKMCEDLDNTDGLRNCYSITKNMFMLNRNSLNEALLNEKVLKDVIGMLEYDPAHQEKRNHREFLYEKATFKQVLPITNEDLKEKIHQTYRVQYLQDVCLPAPSLFEENLLSVLNSYIFFSRIDIVTMIQKDRHLTRELFDELRSKDTEVTRRKNLALFLKEFINLSTGLPPNGANSKDNFFKALQCQDMLGTVEPCMKSPDAETRATMIEMLAALVENNPTTIRDFLVKQARDVDDSEVLLTRIVDQLLTDQDPWQGSATQVSQLLRTLLDPDSMLTLQKQDRSDFLMLFYQRSIHPLIAYINKMSDSEALSSDYFTANRHALVVRLLCFCVEHHAANIRPLVIPLNLINVVLRFLKSKHHFLALCALKTLRSVVATKDEFFVRHILKEKVLDRVVECFINNGNRYNLLNSAILELFEYIRSENIKSLIKYTVEHHIESLGEVKYVSVFQDLKTRYEQIMDKETNPQKEERSATPPSMRDRQEEMWFEDDDDEPVVELKKEVNKPEFSPRKTGMEMNFPSVLKRKNAIDEDDGAVFSGGITAPITEKKTPIVIKMNNDRSRTPSPAGSPSPIAREDEVSSSQNNSKENSPVASPKVGVALVDYDNSDSDEEDTLPPFPDSIPSSSTGSPVRDEVENAEKNTPTVEEPVVAVAPRTTPSPGAIPAHEYDDEDVSSTSGEEEGGAAMVERRPAKRPSSELASDDSAKRSRSVEKQPT